MQPSISRSMWHRWCLDQCWPEMWKSLDMHMHINGRICMESYTEVVSFIINVSLCITGRGAPQWYVYVYLAEFDFEIYIFENQGSRNSRYEFSLCISEVRVRWIQRLPRCKEWGEALHHHCWAFHLKVSASSYKFLHQLVRVDFIFSLFISRFRGRQIWHLAHCKEWGEALHHRCWVFHLRVSTSSCINHWLKSHC